MLKRTRGLNVYIPLVCSLPGLHGSCSPPDALPKPDVTPPAEVIAPPPPKHRTVTERRREGRYKTFDWAEFRPQNGPTPHTLELADLERRKRREERRRRYEGMLGISLCRQLSADKPAGGAVRSLSPRSQQKVEEEVEECWRLVESTVLRLDRTVPLLTEAQESVGVEALLDGHSKEVRALPRGESATDRWERRPEFTPDVSDHLMFILSSLRFQFMMRGKGGGDSMIDS